MPVRRCLTCRREIRSGTRCSQCERNRRPSGGARYPWQYQRNRAELLATDPPCYYCGAPATTADHLVPISEGGSHDRTNLVPACAHCNTSKLNRSAPRTRPR